MRISREEEHFIGRARPSLHGRVKVGFTKEGMITAIDGFVVMDNGPYDPQGDGPTSGRMISLMYQPETIRWRGITVLTNTPPRVSQSQPGGFQGIALMEPILVQGLAQTRHRSGRAAPHELSRRQGADGSRR